MTMIEMFDQMSDEHKKLMAKQNGLSVEGVRKLLEGPQDLGKRHKSDKKVLDNINMDTILDLPFAKEQNVVPTKFQPQFDTKDMVKLEAKKNLPKMSREERRKR